MPSNLPLDNTKAAVAPWWHTVLVLLVLAFGSVASARQHGLANLNLPGMSVRLSGYFTVLALEWLLALFIWVALRRRGLSFATLVAGRWHSLRAFFKDLGFALAFLLVGIPLTMGLTRLIGASSAPVSILPRTPLELAAWIMMSATAGFCEELIFRGYLTQQFAAFTNSKTLAIAIQGLAFGLAHGYQGRIMIVLTIYGWLFGVFASWRKSLRPGMMAHGIQDTLGGLLAFLFIK